MPHSEIFGSKPVRSSPKLIAAYHVLHRLSAPRHPPDTLKALDCARNQKTDGVDLPLQGETASALRGRLGRRTSIAFSNSKRPVLLQTHPGSRGQAKDHDWYADERQSNYRLGQVRDLRLKTAKPRSRLVAETGCASSSQCQFEPKSRPTVAGSRISHPARSHRPLSIEDPSSRRALRRSRNLAAFKLISSSEAALSRRRFHIGRIQPNLVEPDGIEPTTSCLQSTRSPN